MVGLSVSALGIATLYQGPRIYSTDGMEVPVLLVKRNDFPDDRCCNSYATCSIADSK